MLSLTLRAALPLNRDAKGGMPLLHVLRAYEAALRRRGMSPDQDTYYYRLLLKLSFDSEPDWGPSRAKSASRSLWRALLMSQVNTGSLYRRGKRT